MSESDQPSAFTLAAHERALTDPTFDWQNRQDFEFASRGLIHRPDDPAIVDANDTVVWHHETFESFLHGDAPTTVHPSLWRHALLNNYRGLFKVTEGVYQVRGESLANVTFVESDNGYIVIDPLNTVEVAAYSLNLLYEHVGKRPIVAMVYSHTHSDHFGGVRGMISEQEVKDGKVRVIASEGFLEWVLKEQGLVAEGFGSRNAYMYGENLPVSPTGIVDTGLGQAIEGGEITLIEPTDIIGVDGGQLTIDGVELDFMYAPGEAPTGMHCYIDKYKTLHVADNCYMCLHNVYTIRGAFPRDAMQWADSVARSQRYVDTEFLVSGHNWPVFGKEEIQTFLGQQRDGIKYMHDQTLRLMSHGYVPAEIANAIAFPPALARLWHLRGYYGSLQHNVRGIYTYYLGWYDGNPANLDALPPRELAQRTLDYMGGADVVIEKAKQDFDKGDYRWVVHVLDHILWAQPDHEAARALAAAAHTQLGYGAENATWRNAYLSAAQELRGGLPEPTKNARLLRDVVKGMNVSLLLNALSIRLNGPMADGLAFSVAWKVTDTDESSTTTLSNCVLVNRDGCDDTADLTVTLDRLTLSMYVLGQTTLTNENAHFQGDAAVLTQLDGLLETFPVWFPVASHDFKTGERDHRHRHHQA
ncbi:MAG: MBL fold metallo-hydrolase [Gammaproteobacteria bacterium]|nr:MBL fold metallo-hydrolase [Gammaproteobacteria bacterium]